MSQTSAQIGERMLDQILQRYRQYSGGQSGEKIEKAYAFASEAHGDQRRATGEPYIVHPLAVAAILTDLEVDEDTLVAALLHDTVEDTGKTI
nr:bifunctional (p)ppGpp synthetase/guanosine-3',5'-bis(diphosphate) 3'-pyrophosphohydrolase [Clostridia bacterium]